MLKIGEVVGGRYKVLHLVGRGGMSNVYLVINEAVNKQWAIKEVRRSARKDHELLQQNLIAETNILKQLSNPHLPSIVDIFKDEEEGTLLIVMDYIEGITLSRKLKEEGAQPEERVVNWALQLCEVLTYLHSQNPPIIYRDTKPSNIMLKPDGTIILIDFGTARVYKEGQSDDTTCLGTKGYAAPEQYGRSQTDARTDIYNLGATMYHLVTGHNPNLKPYEMYPIRHWDRSLSSGLEKIILKCTKPNPDERYQDCAELAYDLRNYKNLEDPYMRGTEHKWRIFLGTCALSAACLIGGFTTGGQAHNMQTDRYEIAMRNAESTQDTEDRLSHYIEAAVIDPGKLDAYEGILKRTFLEDGVYTADEAARMTEILGTESGGRSLEEALRANTDNYAEFAYEMGLAYFYYYGDTGSKSLSLPWFSIAKDAKSLGEVRQGRAERFAGIASYYSTLASIDKAGDTSFSYADYWKDLCEATRGDIAEEDNDRTAIVMYKELAYQASMHAHDFRKAGLSEDEMREGLAIAQNGADILSARELDEYAAEGLAQLKEMILAANEAITIAYGRESAG